MDDIRRRVEVFQRETFGDIKRIGIPRGNFVWAYSGASGYGKTAQEIQTAKLWLKYNPRKSIIAFDPKGDIEKSGILVAGRDKIIPRGMKDFGHELTRQTSDKKFVYNDFLLILDDYKAILTDDKTPESFLDFLCFARQMNADVILSTHSPSLIIPRMAYYITHYSIFYSQGASGGFEKKSSNYVACEQARILINKYVSEYGKGEYPNFPHIEVDSANEKDLFLVNIDEKKMMKLVA